MDRLRAALPLILILGWLALVALKPELRQPTARATSGSAAPLAWLGLGAQGFAAVVWWWVPRSESLGALEAGLLRLVALASALGFWWVGLRAG